MTTTTTAPGRDPGADTEQEEDDVSNHRQSTDPGPSVVSIVVGWLLVAAALALTGRLIWADPMTEENLIGAVLGFTLALVLMGQVIGRAGDRTVARNRIRREAERIKRAARLEREERARNTGTWEGDGPGQVLTVRWDPAARVYLVQGWLGDFWQASAETPWPDLETLAAALTEFERAGELIAWADEGTRSVRARLDLPGWDGTPVVHHAVVTLPRDVDQAREHLDEVLAEEPRREVGEDTAVIQLRPSGAAVFQTEAERAAWATDETQTFPRS